MRIRRLLAVAHLEIRSQMKGRDGLRFVGLAFALLLPASLIPSPITGLPTYRDLRPGDRLPDPPPAVVGQPKIGVRGHVPAGLEPFLTEVDNSRVILSSDAPVRVETGQISSALRGVLDTLANPPQVEFRRFRSPLELPGRSLLLAILAMSLLAGPIAEAVPGERARRTLEVLLSAGITRGELIGGKWLAWTSSATMTAWISAAIGCWRGLQEPGWWILGLALFIGCAVALSLWLVRFAEDVVGGTAAPMRVLPVVATACASAAGLLSLTHPLLAAAVPIGGPLLVAADIFRSPAQAAAALVGSAATVTLLLSRTGKDLDQIGRGLVPHRYGAIGLGIVATLLWWLAVAGPGIWAIAGNASLAGPPERSILAGALLLVTCAVVALARDPSRLQAAATPRASLAVGLVVALVVGATLAAAGPLRSLGIAPPDYLAPLLERLHAAALPFVALRESGLGAVAAIASIAGQTLLFRHVASVRLGWMGACAVWAVAVCPTAPWSALLASLALGSLAARFGAITAMVAHTTWTAGVAFAPSAPDATVALALQAVALAVTFAATKLGPRSPIRHQL